MNWLAAGLAAAAIPVLLVAGALTQTSMVLVDLTIEDGPRVVVPVPIALARAGLAVSPRGVRYLEAPELAEAVPDLRRIIDGIRDAPDGVFVEIERPHEHVTVSKRGDVLHVSAVEGDRTELALSLPLAALTSIDRAYDLESGTIRTATLVSALRDLPRGPLLHVIDGGTEVRVRAW